MRSGAAAPKSLATSAATRKMLAPIVVLMMSAARPGTPIARTNCASALRGEFPRHAETLIATADRGRSVIPSGVEESLGASIEVLRGSSTSLGMTGTTRQSEVVAKPAELGLVCPLCAPVISKIIIPSCGSRVFPTDEAYAGKVRECAEWLVKLQAIGLRRRSSSRPRVIRWSGRKTNISLAAAA